VRLANGAVRGLHHARATSAISARIRANVSSEVLMLVWTMAQREKCADHDERDRRVECEGTSFLRKKQCKKHHSEAQEDARETWLAPKPPSLYGSGGVGAALDSGICIFGHVGIDE